MVSLFAAVVFISVAVTEGMAVCPHNDLQEQVARCASEMPAFSKPPSTGQREPGNQSEVPYRTGHQQPNVNHTIVRQPLPAPIPDLSAEFFSFFCSDQGEQMIACASDLIANCSDEPSVKNRFFINPGPAQQAHEICPNDNVDGFSKAVSCLNKSFRSGPMTECVLNNSDKYYSQGDQSMSRMEKMCSLQASNFNCIVSIGSRECNKVEVEFMVFVMRAMSPRVCSPIMDRIYKQPTSAAPSVLLSVTLSLALLVSVILLGLEFANT